MQEQKESTERLESFPGRLDRRRALPNTDYWGRIGHAAASNRTGGDLQGSMSSVTTRTLPQTGHWAGLYPGSSTQMSSQVGYGSEVS